MNYRNSVFFSCLFFMLASNSATEDTKHVSAIKQTILNLIINGATRTNLTGNPDGSIMADITTLDETGSITILTSDISVNSYVLLTAQPGTVPTGTLYVSEITPNTSFTIASTAGEADSGVNVYWLFFAPSDINQAFL